MSICIEALLDLVDFRAKCDPYNSVFKLTLIAILRDCNPLITVNINQLSSELVNSRLYT